MFKSLNNIKEILIFCIISALSFILMSEVIKNIDPITSTFVTYGISLVFYFFLNFKNISKIINVFMPRKKDFLLINICTLINTLSAFVVMKYIPPITYVIVFFSSIPFFTKILDRKIDIILIKHTIILLISLAIAGMISHSSLDQIVIGVSITLISSLFATIYMIRTSNLHSTTEITSTQVLTARFFLVVFICGTYSLYNHTYSEISFDNITIFIYIALTSSIIPFFLLQSSIRKIGSELTSKFLPLIPILCLILMTFFSSYNVSIKEILIVLFLTLFILTSI